MKSLKQFLGFSFASLAMFLLTGCDYNRPQPTSKFPDTQNFMDENGQVVSQGEYYLNDFNTVVVSGAVDLKIKDNAPENKVTGKDDPDILSRLEVTQKGCVVYITAKSNRLVHAELDTKFSQSPINLVAGGRSVVNMDGNYVTQQINVSGRTNLKLYWINSSHLKIIAKDRAKLFLAGVVTHLDISAFDQSEVNGKYLRAEDSYVYAANNANVGVNVRSALGNQSLDNATVYYYKDPESSGIYLKDSGSALRMKGLAGPSNNLLD